MPYQWIPKKKDCDLNCLMHNIWGLKEARQRATESMVSFATSGLKEMKG